MRGENTRIDTKRQADNMNNSSAVRVRELAFADRSEWARLWQGYLAFYETQLPTSIYDSYFTRLLGNDPRDYTGLVAEIDGRLVGLAHFLFHRHGWKSENVCYLQDLYTDADARGKGAGAALMQAVYAKADAAGAPSVYWLTQEFNTDARRLYDRVGKLTPFIKYQRAA